MILNGNVVTYLEEYGIRKVGNSSLPPLLNLEGHKKYWYIEFKRGLNHLPEALPDPIKELIRQKKLYLILANIFEAFHSVVEHIYTVAVDQLNLPEEMIILVTESADIMITVRQISAQRNKKEIQVLWARIFESQLGSYAKNAIYETSDLYYKRYDKKFINFNRRWRLHRPLFVSLLIANNLLDDGYVSLAKSDDNNSWNTMWPQIMHYHAKPYNQSYPELLEILSANQERICSTPDLYLDNPDLVTNRADPTKDTDLYYSDTYFSVVSETNFYTSLPGFESGRFFSEKTFKPIIYKHPFILLSPPHSLDKLREIKYKTFSPYINEDYDIEPNDFKRMLMIVEEVKRLCRLQGPELVDFLEAVRPICEYNFELLKSKNVKVDFVQRLNYV